MMSQVKMVVQDQIWGWEWVKFIFKVRPGELHNSNPIPVQMAKYYIGMKTGSDVNPKDQAEVVV